MTTVLVASGGGHLQQLMALVPRLSLSDEVIWATPRSGLSDGLLEGQRHFELPYSRPRDYANAFRLTGTALSMLRRSKATRIISTGASPAPPFFLAGAMLGLEMHYIESATRSVGPSLSGRLVSRVPSAHLYTQYPSWADDRWRYSGSVFDAYASAPVPGVSGIRSAVVTLGTEDYDFRRAVRQVLQVLPPDVDVTWQTGATDVTGLGIKGYRSIPGQELRRAIGDADVVIAHAGTGSVLTALELGKIPVLIPREARFDEHVDDHQMLTARELSRRGLAISARANELSVGHLEDARMLVARSDDLVRPFALVARGCANMQRSV